MDETRVSNTYHIIRFENGKRGGVAIDKNSHLQSARDFCMAQRGRDVYLILRDPGRVVSYYRNGRPSVKKPIVARHVSSLPMDKVYIVRSTPYMIEFRRRG